MTFPVHNELPIACSLTATAKVARGVEINALFRHAVTVQELDDGYSLSFPTGGGWEQELLAFIDAERACCPFFTFGLMFPSPHKEIWLTIGGGASVKAVLKGEWASLLAHKESTGDQE